MQLSYAKDAGGVPVLMPYLVKDLVDVTTISGHMGMTVILSKVWLRRSQILGIEFVGP